MLASVFDIESERGIIAGKIFDVKITVVVDAAVRRQRDGQHVRDARDEERRAGARHGRVSAKT